MQLLFFVGSKKVFFRWLKKTEYSHFIHSDHLTYLVRIRFVCLNEEIIETKKKIVSNKPSLTLVLTFIIVIILGLQRS